MTFRQADGQTGAASARALQAIFEQGVALHKSGQLAEARRRYEEVLRQDPAHFDSLNRLAWLCGQTGQNGEAAALFSRSLRINPAFAPTHCNLAVILLRLGRVEDALASAERSIALGPNLAEAHLHRGAALTQLNRHEDALASLDRAIGLAPNQVEAHFRRGVALGELGRCQDAAASYDRVIGLDPQIPEAHYNRGLALHQMRRFAEAVESFDRAIALRRDYAEAHNSRGITLYELRRPGEAIASFDAAIALKPHHAQAHFGRAIAQLSIGDLKEGFESYRWRTRLPWFQRSIPDLPFPPWEGESLAGKTILVHCEQGFGDSLQFIRYVKPLAAMAARVVVIAPAALESLFRRSIPGVEFMAAYDGAAFDYRVLLMSLPLLFGTTLETIPAEVPYLAAEADRIELWAERLRARAARLEVGLVWAGDSRADEPQANAIDRRRSLTLAQLAPLAAVAGVRFVSLQKGEPADQALRPPRGMALIDPTADLHDFADTAALIANLDLVITVDTSVAHLAGALGKPVWILSRFDGCWRWLNGREDSPWYPTARLFHQTAAGAWDEVVGRVARELKALAGLAPDD